MEQEPKTVTVRRARELSGLGITSLYQLMKDGKLKSKLIGRRRLIDYQSLCELLTGEGSNARAA
jgi:hypothetical protein